MNFDGSYNALDDEEESFENNQIENYEMDEEVEDTQGKEEKDFFDESDEN